MNKYTLPTYIEIDGVECDIDSDYRNILQIFEILNDPDLLPQESAIVALDWFYTDDKYKVNRNAAIKAMFDFIACGDDTQKKQSSGHENEKLYDWDWDFNIIISAVNKILGFDARGVEYLHWWTFMSAFMSIGECTFSTYVGIRKKLARNIKLEKYEEKLYREHRNEIILPKKYDKGTQELMDLIMGEDEED